MTSCTWTTDPATGDLTLIVDGTERARIPNPDHVKMDQDKPGGSIIGLDDIKEQLERMAGYPQRSA